jgi:hypothetical protein
MEAVLKSDAEDFISVNRIELNKVNQYEVLIEDLDNIRITKENISKFRNLLLFGIANPCLICLTNKG